MVFAVILALLATMIYAIDHLYHRTDLSSVPMPDPDTDEVRHFRRHFRDLASKPLDNYLAPLMYAGVLMWIVAANIVFFEVDSFIVDALVVLFVAGRFRSLQEIGHHAAHGSLCPNRKFGELITNLLYQFPAFMPEIKNRHQVHVVEHHRSVNQPHDPDLKELTEKGFQPGVSEFGFWTGFFYPLTPNGLAARLKECWGYLAADWGSANFFLRIGSVAVVSAIYLSLGLYAEFLWLYVAQILVFYPLLYWIAHVALHRWFATCDDDIPYHKRELALGRPTDFPGISGFLIRTNIFPYGDSYHLAHSLFPTVRWNHLPKVDKLMKQASAEYRAHGSSGLVIGSDQMPSAISELRSRMVRNMAPASTQTS